MCVVDRKYYSVFIISRLLLGRFIDSMITTSKKQLLKEGESVVLNIINEIDEWFG